jgi:acylphosphatase
MMAAATCRRHLVVSGRVQGVGFRYSTQRQATRLGLCGWVRNTDDGKVEIMAEGPLSAVDALEAWCRHGPPGARVTSVVTTDLPVREVLGPFAIAR